MFYIREDPAIAIKTLEIFADIAQYIVILAKCCCDTARFRSYYL